jgi:hypothetical protein
MGFGPFFKILELGVAWAGRKGESDVHGRQVDTRLGVVAR